MSTQNEETVTVSIATKNLLHEGQHFEKGTQVPVAPDAPADLPVKRVEMPKSEVAFEWGAADWDWTPPAPEDHGLTDALKSMLETARGLLTADPEAAAEVQAVDARIQSMQGDLNERRETLRPFADAANQARRRKQEALAALKEIRVQKELGEADEADVEEAEARLQEASAEVEQAARELEKRKPTAEARIAALESALDRLKAKRERALSVAEMSIVTGTADTAHALFSQMLSSLRDAFQAFQAVRTLNAEQEQRRDRGWVAKGSARLPIRRFTVNMREEAAVLRKQERRLKKVFRDGDLELLELTEMKEPKEPKK